MPLSAASSECNPKSFIKLTRGHPLTPLLLGTSTIYINGKTLSVVEKFPYLGSTISNTNSLDAELDCRIGKAATTFGRLRQRVWSNRDLSIKLKIRVYVACVLSILLYCSESWTTYRRQDKSVVSTLFTSDACAPSLVSPGATMCQMFPSCGSPELPTCSPC